MLKMVLIRPGATEYDEQHRIQGKLAIPLSQLGRDQAQQTAVALRHVGIQVLYTAPCTAAKETAELLGDELDLRVKVLDKLLNINLGLWQGMLVDEVRTKQPKVYRQWQENPDNICPPEGEMLSSVRQRVDQVLTKLSKKHKEATIGLVAPEPLASLIRCFFSDLHVGDLWKQAAGGSWEIISEMPTADVAAR